QELDKMSGEDILKGILKELKKEHKQIAVNAIRKAAEVVAAKLQKENFPTVQALAMGRMYVELLAYADKQEKG
ncbi:MAG: hypothetical protein GY928_02635, partial [Colwellia sp.]|nr:hypothetical protein [Colwellia sp.]